MWRFCYSADENICTAFRARSVLHGLRGCPLKIFAVSILAFVSCGAGAFAHTASAPTIKVPADLTEAETKRRAHVAAVRNCEQMWDRGTHMSAQEWARACRRVQNRLKLLDLRPLR